MTWVIGPFLLLVPEIMTMPRPTRRRLGIRFGIGLLISVLCVAYRHGAALPAFYSHAPTPNDLLFVVPVIEIIIRVYMSPKNSSG